MSEYEVERWATRVQEGNERPRKPGVHSKFDLASEKGIDVNSLKDWEEKG